MAYTRGRCTNLDYCSLAASRRDINVLVGEDFVCPECGKPLKAPPIAASRGGVLVPVLIGVGVLAVVGGAVFVGMRMGNVVSPQPMAGAPRQVAAAPSAPAPAPVPLAPAPAQPAPPPATAPVAPPPAAAPVQQASAAAETVLLRLAGSESIGAGLAPSLAAAYLAQIGDIDVKTEQGAGPGQVKVVGARGDRRESIVVQNGTAAGGFSLLAGGLTDVVMAARRILPEEQARLAALGDMTAAGAEHVIGLDALAIVVNPGNSIASMTREQVRAAFTGAIRDWGALGGTAGPVDVFAPDARSETARIFATLALGGGQLGAAVRRGADGRQIAQAVSADPRGIGVVQVPEAAPARVLAVGETGSAPVTPTDKAAVAREEYPFAYRLYLYTPPKAPNRFAQRFVEFALSGGGQTIVAQQGLITQSMKAVPAPVPQTPTERLKHIVADGRKLAVDFRFNPNSSDLDLKGARDIDKVTNYLLSNHYTGDHLILVGFADNQGDPAANVAVSKKRAEALAAMFAQRGLPPGKVVGFGSELPLADNATEEGRQRNRRVEIYILP